MTFEELLQSCAGGRMPSVFYQGKPGAVTTIKDNGKFKGVGVKFLDIDYEVWFWDSPESDNRSKYMRDLTF